MLTSKEKSMETIKVTTAFDQHQGDLSTINLSQQTAKLPMTQPQADRALNLSTEAADSSNISDSIHNGDSLTLHQVYLLSRLLRSSGLPN